MLRFSDAVLSKQERLSRWGFLGLVTAPLWEQWCLIIRGRRLFYFVFFEQQRAFPVQAAV